MNQIKVHQFGLSDPEAPTMVLLHGLTESGNTWPDLLRHYANRFRILAPDLRGHGESPRFENVDNTAVQQLADVQELLKSELAPVILIGHSLGGNLALATALEAPECVAKLVLEDPAAPDDAPRELIAEINTSFLATMASASDRTREISRMRVESSWSLDEIEAWAHSKPLVDPNYISAGPQLLDISLQESFQALSVPTLVIIPDPAPMAPDRSAITNPLITWDVIPEAGHCVRRDQPESFYRALDTFISENRMLTH